MKDHHDFHQALTQQPGLQSLLLRGDPDPPNQMTRDDLEVLINAFISLSELRQLNLFRISDYFTDEHIELLSHALFKLEELFIGGYEISDRVFSSLAKLKSLKQVTFSGITTFTTLGILSFIDKLGDGNRGLSLSVDNADSDTAISLDSQNLIRDVIGKKLDGRFEYQLLRGKSPKLCEDLM